MWTLPKLFQLPECTPSKWLSPFEVTWARCHHGTKVSKIWYMVDWISIDLKGWLRVAIHSHTLWSLVHWWQVQGQLLLLLFWSAGPVLERLRIQARRCHLQNPDLSPSQVIKWYFVNASKNSKNLSPFFPEKYRLKQFFYSIISLRNKQHWYHGMRCCIPEHSVTQSHGNYLVLCFLHFLQLMYFCRAHFVPWALPSGFVCQINVHCI